MTAKLLLPAALLALSACHAREAAMAVPGNADDHTPFSAIASDDTVHFTGTEPFWAGSIAGNRLLYQTPDLPGGEAVAVERFAGRGGISWSGTYRGARFGLSATPGACSDGMSDRSYPYTVTLTLGTEQRIGCAWTDRQLFKGPANP